MLYGASPRASINLALAAKANAFLEQRGFVIPDDVNAVAYEVLRHRIGLNYEAEADGVKPEQIIESLVKTVNKSEVNAMIDSNINNKFDLISESGGVIDVYKAAQYAYNNFYRGSGTLSKEEAKKAPQRKRAKVRK